MLKRASWVFPIALVGAAIFSLRGMGCQATCHDGSDCGEGQFCDVGDGACLTPRASGFCKDKPTSCPTVYQPICGCDGVTYANGCEAARWGTSLAVTGACASMCGGPKGITCPDGQFCSFATVGSCLSPDATGTCQVTPESCSTVKSPVCGCDGKTYDNACIAARAGISVSISGSCDGGTSKSADGGS